MMTLFSSVLNMSFGGSVAILAVLLCRAVFARAPKSIMAAVWAIAAVRLVCPFALTSAFSLMPTIRQSATASDAALTLTVLEETVLLPAAPTVAQSVSWSLVGTVVWLTGMAAMTVYTLTAYRCTRKTLSEAVLLDGRVYECDRIPTPFIFGVVHPKVYVPSSMQAADRRFVIAHETAHIARLDHLWKPLGFAVLTWHWFNPLVWLAYVLFCRDMEIACDERVLRELGMAVKKPYADALINCAAPSRRIAACPLAFGETDVTVRVRRVLRYQRPAWWLSFVAVVSCLLIGMCLLTDPRVQALELPPVDTTVTTTTVSTQTAPTTPTLLSYTQQMAIDAITPRAVQGGDVVTVRVSVQDTRGVQSGVQVLLYRETADMFDSLGDAVTLTLVQGSATDGVYEGEIVIPTDAAAGEYRLRATYIPFSEKPAVCTAYSPEEEAAVVVE